LVWRPEGQPLSRLPGRAPLGTAWTRSKGAMLHVWGGGSLVHHSNRLTGLSAAQPDNQGQEQTSKQSHL